MADTVTTTPDGIQLPVASLAVTTAFSGSLPQTFTVAYQGNTYVQTITYTGTNPTHISQWVKQ